MAVARHALLPSPARARRAARPARLPPARSAPSDDPQVSDLVAIATTDKLIESMLEVVDDDSRFAGAVSANVTALDVKFFLRLASRADTAEAGERAALTALAERTMRLLDRIVAQTRAQMDDGSAALTALITSAAEPENGTFSLPLAAERVAAVREQLRRAPVSEPALSAAYAWMRKAGEDKLDGVVPLLQAVLQLWAGQELAATPASASAPDAAAEALLAALLAQPESGWEGVLAGADETAAPGLFRALRLRMEGVVLGLPNGSYAQRVQAEYLKELEGRVKSRFGDAAARPD